MTWDDARFRAFDFETSGREPAFALQPHRVAKGQSWATCWATSQLRDGKLDVRGNLLVDKVRSEVIDELRALLQQAIDDDVTLVGWNMQFDVSWFFAYRLEDLVHKLKWLDGMLLWKHWHVEPEYDTDRGKRKSYALKPAVAIEWPKYADYAEDVDFHSTEPDELAKLLKYNKRDTAFTLLLAKKYYNLLAENPKRLRAALIEARCIPMTARAAWFGMEVDEAHTRQLVTQLDEVAEKCLEVLAPHGVTQTVVRSNAQLSKLLFDDWGLPVIKTTPAGGRSADKETLHELSFLDPRAKVLRQYREALDARGRFPETILESIEYNGDGRTRPVPRIFGTYTSRLTYDSKQGRNKDEVQTGFALHQMKRGKDFRGELKAPHGYTLVEFDAAGQEFRWMAILSGDETMQQLCMPGEDPHSFMGASIARRDYHGLIQLVHDGDADAKAHRQLGKVGNLSLQYRTFPKKLRSVARVQYNIDMDHGQAKVIHATYQRSYPGVPQYWRRQIERGGRQGYIENLAGRRVQLVGSINDWQVQSTCINYPVQSVGGDQKYLALAVLRAYCVRHDIHFAWDLHDGIYFYVPDGIVQQAIPEIQGMLNNLPYEKAWGFSPPIPLPWDAKYGKSWGELKEWEAA